MVVTARLNYRDRNQRGHISEYSRKRGDLGRQSGLHSIDVRFRHWPDSSCIMLRPQALHRNSIQYLRINGTTLWSSNPESGFHDISFCPHTFRWFTALFGGVSPASGLRDPS